MLAPTPPAAVPPSTTSSITARRSTRWMRCWRSARRRRQAAMQVPKQQASPPVPTMVRPTACPLVVFSSSPSPLRFVFHLLPHPSHVSLLTGQWQLLRQQLFSNSEFWPCGPYPYDDEQEEGADAGDGWVHYDTSNWKPSSEIENTARE